MVISRRDLELSIGSRARVAEVLNHKRPLTLVGYSNLRVTTKAQQNGVNPFVETVSISTLAVE
jgi:antitoxin component HigA of HigAB toxin-antitoxin module